MRDDNIPNRLTAVSGEDRRVRGNVWLLLLGVFLAAVTVGTDPTKEIHHVLSADLGGEIIETRWSAFGRTDLVVFHGDPAQMAIFFGIPYF